MYPAKEWAWAEVHDTFRSGEPFLLTMHIMTPRSSAHSRAKSAREWDPGRSFDESRRIEENDSYRGGGERPAAVYWIEIFVRYGNGPGTGLVQSGRVGPAQGYRPGIAGHARRPEPV